MIETLTTMLLICANIILLPIALIVGVALVLTPIVAIVQGIKEWMSK